MLHERFIIVYLLSAFPLDLRDMIIEKLASTLLTRLFFRWLLICLFILGCTPVYHVVDDSSVTYFNNVDNIDISIDTIKVLSQKNFSLLHNDRQAFNGGSISIIGNVLDSILLKNKTISYIGTIRTKSNNIHFIETIFNNGLKKEIWAIIESPTKVSSLLQVEYYHDSIMGDLEYQQILKFRNNHFILKRSFSPSDVTDEYGGAVDEQIRYRVSLSKDGTIECVESDEQIPKNLQKYLDP